MSLGGVSIAMLIEDIVDCHHNHSLWHANITTTI